MGSLGTVGLMSECWFDAYYIETKQSAKILTVDFLNFFIQERVVLSKQSGRLIVFNPF